MTSSFLADTTSAQRRIASLASRPSVHRAFHWLHLHQPQILAWQLEFTRIPAPPFGEAARTSWFLDRFQQLGLADVHTDAVGNALAELPPAPGSDHRALPCILLSAHLDTVFPADTPCEPTFQPPRHMAPGISDNGAGLAALLALAAALRFASIATPVPLLFAANVGEEGEGNLRGMRHLFHHQPGARIAAAIALEGTGSRTVVTRALGSLRLRVTLTGAGGHSWADAGNPNPIFLLSQALATLSRLPLPSDPRTVLNAGTISGGTSINSIPASASVLLDLRSTDPEAIDDLRAEVEQAFEHVLRAANAGSPTTPPIRLRIDLLGRRPAAELSPDSSLLQTIRAVDRHLGLRTELRIGSTDANIPLSLGIPAVALGGGGTGGGIHTLSEWYDPTGREIALRRLLLTALDTAHLLHQQSLLHIP